VKDALQETIGRRRAEQLESRYEALRPGGLGEALPPECRSGLALLLRRGMWGWGRAVAAGETPVATHRRPVPDSGTPEQHRTLVHVLAAMAMAPKEKMGR
jgi:hypothetical protein